MSYTTIRQPAVLTPVYNDATFIVYDTDYIQPYYAYIFKLYINGSTTPIHISKISPNFSSGYGYFNVNSILKQVMLQNGLHMNIKTLEDSLTNEYIIKYKLDVYCIYNTLTSDTETLLYSYDNNYTFAGRWGINEYLTYYALNRYYPTGNIVYFPISIANTIKRYVGINDFEQYSFIRLNPFTGYYPWYLKIEVYSSTSTLLRYYYISLPTSNTTLNYIQHFGSGPWNLNKMVASDFYSYSPNLSSSFPVIQPATDSYYIIKPVTISGGTAGFPIRYNLEPTCNRFIRYRVIYRTKLGGYDTLTFNGGAAKRMINIESNTYQQYLPYNYTQLSRGSTVYNNIGTESITLYTPILNFYTLPALWELIKSNDIYVNYYDSSLAKQIYIPVVLKNGDYEYLKRQPQRLSRYELTFLYSNQANLANS
jgi:hypothetical protein